VPRPDAAAGPGGGASAGPDRPGPDRPGPGPGPAGDDDLSPEEHAELAARLDELRGQLVSTPAEVVVANHAYGLFELAAIHLSQQPPNLDQARLAVDALGALLSGLAGRLGEAESSLTEALSQIRLTFVQIADMVQSTTNDGAGEAG